MAVPFLKDLLWVCIAAAIMKESGFAMDLSHVSDRLVYLKKPPLVVWVWPNAVLMSKCNGT